MKLRLPTHWLVGLPVLFLMVGLVEILVVRTTVEFPMTLDHAFFLPASYFERNTGILNNPWRSPFPTEILNWHGFLQPALVANLSIDGSWGATFLALNVLAALALSSVAAALFFRRIEPLQSAAILVVTLSLLLDYRARPEVLASVLALALLLLVSRPSRDFLSSRFAAAGSGAVLALLFCSHPAIFLLSSAGLAFAIALQLSRTREVQWAHLLRFIGIAVVAALVVLLVCFGIVYKASPLVYLDGLAEHARLTASRSDTGFFQMMFVFNRFVPLLVLGLLLLPLACWSVLRPARSEGRSARLWWLTSAFIAVLSLLLLYRVAVRIPSTYYNFSGLLPALLVGCALLFAKAAVFHNGKIVWPAAIHALVLGGLVAGSLGGQALWLQQNAAEGRAAIANRFALGEAMRSSVAEGRETCADLAAITASPSFEVTQKIQFLNPTGPAPRAPQSAQCEVYFAVAIDSADRQPPAVSGYRLTLDQFVGPEPMLPVRPLDMRFARYEPLAASTP
jgi:hypothetical protein